ncbi:hypothetical protein BU25DRAFT_395151 [Macroventuria anomochaeta]|uniref:Uncharacterized protein n=1 Tax=Macroventuria anomochaeta TaxID=301207 RepID=A0ACB6RXA1_9PLEO|nr:uncharacterized protein BU25DRAFT_395151 [Macroventuria anomochaeta]KAF2626403.1 hypothetical protein BU25DRAFT_395151 [Macroventuria anomochaeta]
MNNLQGSSTPHQVSAPLSPYLEARVLNLEEAHGDLRGEVDTLRDLYHSLCNSFGKDQTARASPPQDLNLDKSRQSAMQFKQELERLSREVRGSVNGDADEQKASGRNTPKTNGSVPPHMRAASITSHGSGQKSLPPHLRGGKQSSAVNGNAAPKLSVDATKHQYEPLITDGPVDTIVRQTTVPAAAPSPPLSPTTTVQGDVPVVEAEALSLKEWKPCYLTTLESLPADVRTKIPAQQNMATFTFDMLQNTFGGIAWSPGLRYINSPGACLLKNRTYYMLDPMHEPYLPKSPGEHGAKLTAFFNKAPEEKFDNLPEGTNSYTDVPMFVQVSQGRYAYFGNYSQTRWSDKLDNDTMRARVPQHVKEHIAKDLAATPREDWVTRELKKHFFPKPEYEGAILAPTSDDTTTHTVDEEKQNRQVASDIKDYIQELAEWEREANMKTAMIKTDFVLNAFDAADADDPPALRLWWEYLECVDWKLDFYNMLVGFQARANNTK